MASAFVAPFIPPLIAPSVPRRPRPPAWAELLTSLAYLADKETWAAEEVAYVALLEVIAPPHIAEALEALRIRHGHGDRFFAPPTEREIEIARITGRGGPVWYRVELDAATGKRVARPFRVSPEVLQIFEDDERRLRVKGRGAKQGGRKRRKKRAGPFKPDPLKRWE